MENTMIGIVHLPGQSSNMTPQRVVIIPSLPSHLELHLRFAFNQAEGQTTVTQEHQRLQSQENEIRALLERLEKAEKDKQTAVEEAQKRLEENQNLLTRVVEMESTNEALTEQVERWEHYVALFI